MTVTLLILLGIFLLAYGNAMNSVVFRRRRIAQTGKEGVTVPGRAYQYAAYGLIGTGLALVVGMVIGVLWLGQSLPGVG